jgi:ribosomal protein L11 methyltransferase
LEDNNGSMASGIATGADAGFAAILKTDEQSAHRLAELAAETFTADDAAVSFVDIGAGSWRVTIYFHAAPNRNAVRALTAQAAGAAAAKTLSFERVAAKDWVAESLAGLKPVAAGRFIVHGAHDRTRIPLNRIGIEIEAALAFGTGHHGTTRGGLLALDRICKSAGVRRPSRILDLGTGSGVLAIACASALRQPVLATDIDSVAVRAARANARLNQAGGMVEVVKADGVAALMLRQRAPFDLIFANILLRPLQSLAAPLTRLTARGGRVVLSGLLRSQANAALAAYPRLVLERRIDVDGWSTLVLVRPRRRRARVARRRPAT